jgi:hypothetical protein
VSVSGTVAPNFQFDSNLAGWTVKVVRADDPGTVLAGDRLAGTAFALPFRLSFKAQRTADYEVVVPQHLDRRRSSTDAGSLEVVGAPTIAVKNTTQPLTARVSGQALPAGQRINAEIVIQGHKGTDDFADLTTVPLSAGQQKYGLNLVLPSAGKWFLRAKYTDPGAVTDGLSTVKSVKV